MRLRKLLAMLLTLSMLISMVPSAAFAAETGSAPSGETEVPTVVNPDNLFLDKTATLTGDGTYTIKLEAYATGNTITKTITEGVPLDVVLVMDQSGSLVSNGDMLTTLKSSVSSFLESLRANGEEFGVNHRVAICGFASHSKQNNSGLAADEYSYANDIRDNAWTNTGIFVDGEFLDYGTVEYTEITDPDDISTSNMYTIKGKLSGDDIYEYTTVRYSNGVWYSTVNGDTVAESGNYTNYGYLTATQALWLQYYVYTVGNSVNQLTDNDYAAAWENIADGENGQGSLNTNIATAVEHLSSNGATATFMGMKMARKMLENLPAETDGVQRKKIVIVFTDGEPGPNGYAQGDAHVALSEAARIKDGGTEIYTIGIYSAASATTVETFMNWMSSNYVDLTYTDTPIKLTTDLFAVNSSASSSGYVGFSANGKVYYYRGIDGQNYGLTHYFIQEEGNYWPVCIRYDVSTGSYYARYITDDGEYSIPSPNEAKYYQLNTITPNSEDYYKHASDISDLSGIFETISSEMTSFTSALSLDANAVLKDVLADGFTLTDNATITVSVVPGSVSEENKDLTADELTADKITWGEAQQILSFAYPTATTGKGAVTVGEETIMTLTAKAGEDGVVTVSGFDYANQFISFGHDGYKLVVSITGVEADANITTGALVETNLGTSGIYEGAESDADEDGTTGEIQAAFPIPTTYLSSKTYYLDYTGKITIDPKDFLMTVKGVNADIDGYHYFGEPGTTVYTEYGKITVNEDGTITYELVGSDWEHNDVFYLFGTTENPTVTGATANANGNMWSKIIIIPPEDIRGKLYVDKTATLTDNGTYTIDLEAYATGTPIITSITEGIPLDVVLVIDQSGSLHTNGGTYDGVPLQMLKESVSEFVETLKANGEAYGVDHRISMCGFGSRAKQGPSGLSAAGYTYAGANDDNAWINTGLFVDGEFRDYATVNYTRITSPDQINNGKYYTGKLDVDGDGIDDYVRLVYHVGYSAWRYNGSNILVNGDTKEDNNALLLEKCEVYDFGESTLQLDDDDYAASWENLASGANGQGSINPDILKTIDSLAANGATATFYGMKMASKMLENAPEDGIQRKKVVVVFTDGEPGYGGYVQGDADAALSEVMKIKETGVEVYAVGVYSSASEAKVNTFMNHLSSNYSGHSFTTNPTRIDMSQVKTDKTGTTRLTQDIADGYSGLSPYFKKVGDDYWPVVISWKAVDQLYYASYITDTGEVELEGGAWDDIPELVGDVYMLAEPEINEDRVTDYYKYSGDINELSAMFQEIATDATTISSQVSLDADAILKDVMADGFVLTDNTTITVSVVPGSVSEANKDLTADELTKDKITWGDAQQVLTFNYSEVKEGTGKIEYLTYSYYQKLSCPHLFDTFKHVRRHRYHQTVILI